jgi:AcrR family transcriptional regulator
MRKQVQAQVKDADRIEKRRATIVAAAIRVFKEKGFHAATIRDVGIAAGLTQGSLYNYVRSKDDVLFLVCEEVTTRYTEQVRSAVEGIDDPTERLHAAVGALVRTMHAQRGEIQLIYQESHALSPEALASVENQMSEFIEFFEGVWRDARPVGTPVASPGMAADLVTFVPTLLALRGWHLRRHSDVETTIEEVTAFILRGLGCGPEE